MTAPGPLGGPEVPGSLSDEAAALYGTIGSMITSGIGADRAYSILRDAGAGVPRSQVRTIAAQIRNTLSVSPSLARLDYEQPVPASLVSTNSSQRSDQYLHTAAILLRDVVTQYTSVTYYTYASPDLVTPGEVFEAGSEAASEGGSWEGFEVLSMSLVSVTTGL